MYLHKRCTIKQFVINYRNNCSHKLLAAIISEHPDYSLVQKLENDGAIWG
jgi:hypothetical protein